MVNNNNNMDIIAFVPEKDVEKVNVTIKATMTLKEWKEFLDLTDNTKYPAWKFVGEVKSAIYKLQGVYYSDNLNP